MPLRQRATRFDVPIIVVSQYGGHGSACCQRCQRVDDVPPLPRRNIEDAHRSASLAHPLDRITQELLNGHLALANARPAGAVQVGSVDNPPETQHATRFVLVNVIKRTTRVETRPAPETNSFAESPNRLQE